MKFVICFEVIISDSFFVSNHFVSEGKAGDLNPGEQHLPVTRDDGMVKLCTLRAAIVLSRNCCTDFGRLLPR